MCIRDRSTSVKIVDYLLQNSITLTGAVMKNRTAGANLKLKDEKFLKRGEWYALVTEDENICVIQWNDNKCVTLLASSVGSDPLSSCKRWTKEAETKISLINK